MTRDFKFYEKPKSRQASHKPPRAQYVYLASGDGDEMFVLNYAVAHTDLIISHPTAGLLFRQDVQVQEVGHLLYEVTVPYGPRDKQTGSIRRSFDTTSGTVRIRTSRQTVAAYGDAPANFKQLINVRRDGEVEGVDIVIPALKRTYEYTYPSGVIAESSIKQVSRITGHVNSVTWQTYEPGEVLFLGGQGSDGDNTEATAAFHFVMSENAVGLSIGDITGIAKDGHDAIWVTYEDYADSGKPAVKPLGVYVERVYPRSDFASVLGF